MKNIKVLVCIFILSTITTVSAQAGRWIVKNPKQNAIHALRGLNHHFSLNFQNEYLVLDLSDDERIDAQQLIQLFKAESAFEDVKIVIDQPVNTPTDEIKGWHVKALEYSTLSPQYNGQGIIVAVLDTGVDYKHVNLESKMWKNTMEIPENGIDDDNNGLIDDYHGYNFNENVSDPFDTGNHGTHCAGIIAASQDKETIAQGVAQDVQIMPLTIISKNNAGFLSGAAQAVKYAVDNGAQVLSNSWRIYRSWKDFMNEDALLLLKESIMYAHDHEVIFVAAAGNESKNLDQTNLENPIYPLALEGLKNVLGVASTTRLISSQGIISEEISYFSNYGTKLISVAAPGQSIYSTVPYGRWASMSGTSMATPIVAGTIARGLSKGFSMYEAMDNLNNTTQKNSEWKKHVTHGRIDIKKYLE